MMYNADPDKRAQLILEAKQRLIGITNVLCKNHQFLQIDGPPKPHTDSGNIYKVWAGGYKEEGEPVPLISYHPKHLLNLWTAFLTEELESKKEQGYTKIVWRRRPEVTTESYLDFDKKEIFFFKITARFTFE